MIIIKFVDHLKNNRQEYDAAIVKINEWLKKYYSNKRFNRMDIHFDEGGDTVHIANYPDGLHIHITYVQNMVIAVQVQNKTDWRYNDNNLLLNEQMKRNFDHVRNLINNLLKQNSWLKME